MPGQRKNTRLLTSRELDQMQRLLGLPPIEVPSPGPAPAGAQAPASKPAREWRGTKDGPFRSKLVSELTSKLNERLATDHKEAHRRDGMRKLDLAAFEAAGGAAKEAVDDVFAAWTAQAPLAPTTIDRRRKHQFAASGPNANILDVADVADRDKGRMPVSGRDMAKYWAANDDACKKVMARYDFDPKTGTADEADCLSALLDWFYTENQLDLDYCDRLGYWMANPDLGVVFAPRYVEGWTYGDGYDVLAIWERKAVAYLKLIHEYIHVLQHPLVPPATSPLGQDPPLGTNTIKEGVCEYLTTKVMAHLAQKSDDELDAIAVKVEGSSARSGRGAALKASVKNYQPGYATEVGQVQQAITLMGGENGLLAAFFQGHTEYIGRYYARKWLDGVLESVLGGPRSMPAPDTFATVDALTAATGLSIEKIRQANPHISPIAPTDSLSRKQVYLPGFHAHLMVVDHSGDEDVGETWAMIAAHHDVAADRIQQANGNPADMPFGGWILVPDS